MFKVYRPGFPGGGGRGVTLVPWLSLCRPSEQGPHPRPSGFPRDLQPFWDSSAPPLARPPPRFLLPNPRLLSLWRAVSPPLQASLSLPPGHFLTAAFLEAWPRQVLLGKERELTK